MTIVSLIEQNRYGSDKVLCCRELVIPPSGIDPQTNGDALCARNLPRLSYATRRFMAATTISIPREYKASPAHGIDTAQ